MRSACIMNWLLAFMVNTVLAHTEAAHPCDSIQGNFDDWLNSATHKDVVIVGGGAAGLSAAKELLTSQYTQNIMLLEAQDYLGGRVKTYRQGNILVEDGAEWMNGGSVNRLYKLSKELGKFTKPLPPASYDWRAMTNEGLEADARGFDAALEVFMDCEVDSILKQYLNKSYGQCYIDRFDGSYWYSQAVNSEREGWFQYLRQWVNKDMGTTDWGQISANDADSFTDWGADEWNQWKDGFDALINYLAESIPSNKMKLSSPVCKVFWDQPTSNSDKVLVVTKDGQSYLTHQVIITASVGHLKDRHSQIFDPQLPQDYRSALDGIELGIANKVQIGWDQPWWSSNPLNLHIIFPKQTLPQQKSWLYGIMEMLSIHQQSSLIQGFMAGQYAIDMENLPEETVKNHLLQHLKDVTGQNVPEPTFFRRSQWMANPWMRGSYNSYVSLTGFTNGLISRKPLAQPLVNSNGVKVVYWAGEHLSTTRYGTVDGAMDTGEEQAYNLMLDNP